METKRIMRNSIFRIVVVIVGILLVPLFGNWPWTVSDFVIMGALVFTAGLMLDLAIKKAGKYRAIVAAAIILLFLWLWAELAVGLFTNWGS